MENVSARIKSSPEWKSLVREVYKRTTDRLSESKIHQFSSLDAYERSILVDDVGHDLHDTSLWRSFQEVCSKQLMDELLESGPPVASHVIATAARHADELLELQALNDSKSRTAEHVSEATDNHILIESQGSESEQPQASLELLLNQSIPQPLRGRIWRRLLRDEPSRRKFVRAVRNKRLSTITAIDADITITLQRILDRHFADLSDTNEYLQAGKTVLSHYHTTTGGKDIGKSLYLCLVVLVHGLGPDRSIAAVVEAFHAFIRLPRPRLPTLVADAMEVSARFDTVRDLLALFETTDGPMYDHCRALIANHASIDTSDVDMELAVCVGQTAVEQIFAGVLSLDCCVYVWDQCLLAGFCRVVPGAVVAILLLLREQVMMCESKQELARVLPQFGKHVQLDRLQATMEQKFMPELRALLRVPYRGSSLWSIPDPTISFEHMDDFALDEDQDDEQKEELQHTVRSIGSANESVESVKERLSARAEERAKKERKEQELRDRAIPDIAPLETRKLPSSKALSVTDLSNGDNEEAKGGSEVKEEEKQEEKELCSWKIIPEVHGLADTLARILHKDPKRDASKLVTGLKKLEPTFIDQNDDVSSVLRSKFDSHVVFLRHLKADERASVALHVVDNELERVGVVLAKPCSGKEKEMRDALLSELLRFSHAQSGWNPSPREALRRLVSGTAQALQGIGR